MKFPKGIRSFNKHVLNRLTSKIARSSWGPFTLVRHIGRRSGKTYETPIISIPSKDGFVVALTYGPEVDWYKNILAAGGCELERHGRCYSITGIVPLDQESALPYFPGFERLILQLVGIADFSILKISNGLSSHTQQK